MTFTPDVTDGIKRYLWSVAGYLGHLPAHERDEILQEVESHLYEALHARFGDTPTDADLRTLLAEMPPPESYAEGADSPRAATPSAPPLQWDDIPEKVRCATQTWNWTLLLGIGLLIAAGWLLYQGVMSLVLLPLFALLAIPFAVPIGGDVTGIVGLWATLVGAVYIVLGLLLANVGLSMVRKERETVGGDTPLDRWVIRAHDALQGLCWQAVAGAAGVVISLMMLARGFYSIYLAHNIDRFTAQMQQMLHHQAAQTGLNAPELPVNPLMNMTENSLNAWGMTWIIMAIVLAILATQWGSQALVICYRTPEKHKFALKLARFARLFYPILIIGTALLFLLPYVVYALISLVLTAFNLEFEMDQSLGIVLMVLSAPFVIYLCVRIIQREEKREKTPISGVSTPAPLAIAFIGAGVIALLFVSLFRSLALTISVLLIGGGLLLNNLAQRPRQKRDADQQ